LFRKQLICAVVPAYNEEKHVSRVIETMPVLVDNIIVVDDGSTDNTSEKVLESADHRVILLRHKVNCGVGKAIVSGHLKAIELGADISVVMAGDGQMDPHYLPKLLLPIITDEWDYVKGSRFLRKEDRATMPRIRMIGTLLLTLAIRLVSGYWNITDPQNGYTAIKTKTLEELSLKDLANGFQFENDLLLNLSLIGAKVTDVPIPSLYSDQESKLRLRSFIPQTIIFLVRKFFGLGNYK
jgi:glycosyltransferase involved in cell wall biosynthesis